MANIQGNYEYYQKIIKGKVQYTWNGLRNCNLFAVVWPPAQGVVRIFPAKKLTFSTATSFLQTDPLQSKQGQFPTGSSVTIDEESRVSINFCKTIFSVNKKGCSQSGTQGIRQSVNSIKRGGKLCLSRISDNMFLKLGVLFNRDEKKYSMQ